MAVGTALAAVSAAGAAKNPPTLSGSVSGIPSVNVVQQPLGASNADTTVVVQLASDPVAVQDADSSRPFSQSQRDSARNALRQKQQPVENEIRSAGGDVLASYQSAYNGIKVRIKASDAYKLSSLSGVVAVHPVPLMEPSNVQSVPLIGAPAVWGGSSSLHGEGMKIGIIDTGIDYTHADFGGPGDPAQYALATANETVDPALISGLCTAAPCFGPDAPKVKGGIDLAGNSYQPDPTQANYQPNPAQDPNPIDCNGHGTHVAGSAAGFGVVAGDGTTPASTYTGDYNATTVSDNTWAVGPGVAPKADLYAIKIFGCSGPTDLTLDAIDWAVQNGMDVINMSLGSPFGSTDDPAAQAATNAARDGAIVVVASGNEGSNPYMTGSPASGAGALSVGALDPTQKFPGVTLSLTNPGPVTTTSTTGGATTTGATSTDTTTTDTTTTDTTTTDTTTTDTTPTDTTPTDTTTTDTTTTETTPTDTTTTDTTTTDTTTTDTTTTDTTPTDTTTTDTTTTDTTPTDTTTTDTTTTDTTTTSTPGSDTGAGSGSGSGSDSGSGSTTGADSAAASSSGGAATTLSVDATLTALDANGATLPTGTFSIKVIPPTAHDTALGDTDSISLGCSADDINPGGTEDLSTTFVVVERGTCARVAKAIFAQQAGAAGVIMINNSAAYPPYEGTITHDPDPPGPPLNGGFDYTVTIPFLGVQGGATPSTSAAGAALVAADGGTLTVAPTTITNPSYLALADFSSYGPATTTSALKPDVTAPGVSIESAGMGSGTLSAILSGTSQATPHVSGLAALVKQAHPDWGRVAYWKAAIANTGDPNNVANYSILGAGTGLVQAPAATQTQVVALGDRDTASLSFGFNELSRDYNKTDTITLRNFGSAPATFAVSAGSDAGVPHSVSLSSSSVTVPPHDERHVRVRLTVPAATAGSGIFPGTGAPFGQAAGIVTFSPTSGSNNGVSLQVPYLMVPQAVSNVDVRIDTRGLRHGNTATATVTNRNGAIPGTADWYAWGLSDRRDRGLGSDDLRAAGVQSFPAQGVLSFAIATQTHWSNAAQNEFDVLVDTNNDGTADYDVFAADYGAVTTGEFDGIDAVFTLTLDGSNAGDVTFAGFVAGATDSSTMTLPVFFSQLCDGDAPCLNAANPRFSYTVESFGLTDNTADSFTGSAKFNAFNPAISTGMYDVVDPNGVANETITVDPTELQQTPVLGVMVVSTENESGADEASLTRLDGGPSHWFGFPHVPTPPHRGHGRDHDHGRH